MRFAHLLSRFYTEQWGIRPDHHVALGVQLQRELTLRGVGELRAEDFVGPTYRDDDGRERPLIPQMEVVGSTAVIPVHGVLGRHLGMLELWCGGCDYDNVMAMTDQAEGRAGVERIVYDFRSPGGMCLGAEECAQRIREARKPTIAYTSDQACSCAYLLASQCPALVAAPSAVLGCIGTYIALLDSSRALELAGFKLEVIRAGKYKAAGIDGKALTDEERAWLQGQVDESNAVMVAAISARRPQIAADSMQGQWMSGRQGLVAGLVDELCPSLADLLAHAPV